MQGLREIEKNLQTTVDAQTIKPEEVVELTNLKEELTKKLEETKKAKEKISKLLNSIDRENINLNGEKERLFYEISSTNESSLSIESIENISALSNRIETTTANLKESLLRNEEKEHLIIEATEELKMAYSNEKNNNQFLNSKLLSLGKLYLDKRDRFEGDMRRLRKEVENLETKILRMGLNSRHSMLSLEQQLENVQMRYDESIATIKIDEMMINKIVSKVYHQIGAKKEEIDNLEKQFERIQ